MQLLAGIFMIYVVFYFTMVLSCWLSSRTSWTCRVGRAIYALCGILFCYDLKFWVSPRTSYTCNCWPGNLWFTLYFILLWSQVVGFPLELPIYNCWPGHLWCMWAMVLSCCFSFSRTLVHSTVTYISGWWGKVPKPPKQIVNSNKNYYPVAGMEKFGGSLQR